MRKIFWYDTYLHFYHGLNCKTRSFTNITWTMGGIKSGLWPISTSPIIINTFYIIEQVRVDDLLITTSTYCIITPNISSFVLRVYGMGPIYNSPITNNIFSCNVRGKLASFCIPRPMSNIINRGITLIFFVNFSFTRLEDTGEVKNLTQSPWLWEEDCLLWDLYPTLPSTSTIFPNCEIKSSWYLVN